MDQTVDQHVIDALTSDPRIDSTDMGVAVNIGTVTFTGHVGIYAGLAVTERAVQEAPGGRGGVEDTELRCVDETAPQGLVNRAVPLLDWSVAVRRNAMQVKVQDGLVVPTGMVERQNQEEPSGATRQVAGTAGILKHIAVIPEAGGTDLKRGGCLRNRRRDGQWRDKPGLNAPSNLAQDGLHDNVC
ncbi:BON domain-containing protein [Methylobacterium sp. P31]